MDGCFAGTASFGLVLSDRRRRRRDMRASVITEKIVKVSEHGTTDCYAASNVTRIV